MDHEAFKVPLPRVSRNKISFHESKLGKPFDETLDKLRMGLAIIGVGTAVPLNRIAQNEAVQFAKERWSYTKEQAELLSVLYDKTQVQSRASVLTHAFFPPSASEQDRGPSTGERMERYEKEAPLLGLSASRRALTESDIHFSKISQVITVSCTGFAAPGIDCRLIKELNLSPTIGRTHIGFMGCHGSFNALRLASHFVKSDPEQKILLCSVELSSLHFYYGWDPEKVVANALFSDGAGAIVGVHEKQAPPEAWKLIDSGSYLFAGSEDAMSWKIRDRGFEMTLSPAVPRILGQNLRPWLENWLRQTGFNLKEIRSWAIHPGGPRILDEIAHCLDLREEDLFVSRKVLREHGNMSSATLLFILEKLRFGKYPRPCVALGFGPGLAVEAALFL